MKETKERVDGVQNEFESKCQKQKVSIYLSKEEEGKKKCKNGYNKLYWA